MGVGSLIPGGGDAGDENATACTKKFDTRRWRFGRDHVLQWENTIFVRRKLAERGPTDYRFPRKG